MPASPAKGRRRAHVGNLTDRSTTSQKYNTALTEAQLFVDATTNPNNSVPEPGTLAVSTAGLAGLYCYAWRKRR